jgi:hypothetical protein
MSISWREAIIKVLSEEQKPLQYSRISELILSRGYYKTEGATPDSTVNAIITGSIKNEGEKSPFKKVDRGVFSLRDSDNKVTTEPVISEITRNTQTSTVEEEADDSVIRCLGMYWQRDLVIWKNDPRVFGKQQALSRPVDFGAQRGIYILYDHHTVVYVGRSVDRPLGKRLYEHTIDRLGSRWNRFSWFGLLSVTDEGKLVEMPINVTLPSLIATLEALLIEALEPPQNRKRGDDFTVIEYIQDIDPEIKERELQNTLRSIERSLRGQH